MSMAADPRVVHDAGVEVANGAATFGAHLAQLQKALANLGAPWGTDELGTPFGQEYARVAAQAKDALTSYHRQLEYAANGLHATTVDLEEAERQNAEAIQRIRQVWLPPKDT